MVRISGRFDAGDYERLLRRDIEAIKIAHVQGAEEAVDIMRNIISTSGRPTSRGPGRIDTGDMLEGVNERVEEEDADSISVSFGWDIDDFDKPYPVYQEFGFTHVPDGAWIPGMHSLQDATDNFNAKIQNLMNDRGL